MGRNSISIRGNKEKPEKKERSSRGVEQTKARNTEQMQKKSERIREVARESHCEILYILVRNM